MNKTEFDWLAEVCAAMRVRDRITQDGLEYLTERLMIRYPKFNAVVFDKAFRRYRNLFITEDRNAEEDTGRSES